MHKLSRITLGLAVTLTASICGQAQTQSPAHAGDPTPTYRITVVSRTARAVSYKHRSGSTHVDFQGTDLMPSARGEAKVESKRGVLAIEAEFSDLDRPTAFGTEYLTFVMWAISPEGSSVNLGEVLVGDNRRSKLEVTTDLQAFALIVTAEPYYAVRRPSNAVIMENAIRQDTKGTTQAVDAKYELIDRGGYIPTGYTIDPVVLDAKLPLEFFEARNAVRIAKAAGAERYANPSYENAMRQMRNRAAAASADQQAQQARNAQATAEADSDRNRAAAASSDLQAQQAIYDREELRAKLLQQFNLILETRDTARELVVNMSDVLFDSGQFTLRPMAREKLAKISGIVLAYPTLLLAVEGNTDSVGTEEFNQTLSEKRAESVRSYLTKQGVPEASTTAEGFGKTRPIASSDTADGRQQNRRVELIVSGEVIGTKVVSIVVLPVSASSTPR
jgi:outer membrane protein OmpA-like peptidoglycan-associated protein